MPKRPPLPVTVAEDAFHRPLFVTYLGEELRVDSIDQQWQDDDEPWERKPVSRLYGLRVPTRTTWGARMLSHHSSTGSLVHAG